MARWGPCPHLVLDVLEKSLAFLEIKGHHVFLFGEDAFGEPLYLMPELDLFDGLDELHVDDVQKFVLDRDLQLLVFVGGDKAVVGN
jgi:hypothetical protein